MIFKVINTSPNAVNISWTVWNYGFCPANCFYTNTLNVQPNCSNTEFITIFGSGEGQPKLENYEVTVAGVVPGIYVFTASASSNKNLVAANTFRSGDFLPRTFNRTCPG